VLARLSDTISGLYQSQNSTAFTNIHSSCRSSRLLCMIVLL
jgi:hypothetical protein